MYFQPPNKLTLTYPELCYIVYVLTKMFSCTRLFLSFTLSSSIFFSVFHFIHLDITAIPNMVANYVTLSCSIAQSHVDSTTTPHIGAALATPEAIYSTKKTLLSSKMLSPFQRKKQHTGLAAGADLHILLHFRIYTNRWDPVLGCIVPVSLYYSWESLWVGGQFIAKSQ